MIENPPSDAVRLGLKIALLFAAVCVGLGAVVGSFTLSMILLGAR